MMCERVRLIPRGSTASIAGGIVLAWLPLGSAYAKLIEQSLLQREGVLVVELAEAQAVGREIAIAGQAGLERPMPLFLFGNFRNDGAGPNRRVRFTVSLKRGNVEVTKAEEHDVPPELMPAALSRLTERLMEPQVSAAPAKPDSKAEARVFAARGAAYYASGQMSDSLSLFEASLLLDPQQAKVHHQAAVLILEQYFLARDLFLHGQSPDLTGDEATALSKQRFAPSLRLGLHHVEEYMKGTNLKWASGGDAVRPYIMFHYPTDAEVRDMLMRVVRAKYEQDTNDDLMWFVQDFLSEWHRHSSLAERYTWVTEIAVHAGKQTEVADLAALTHGVDGKDTPELRDALKQMAESDNPAARKAAAVMVRRLNAGFWLTLDRKVIITDAAKPVSNARPEVRVVPLHLDIGQVHGCIAAGDKTDLFWACEMELSHGGPADNLCTVYKLDQPGQPHAVGRMMQQASPCFDGRYFWTALNVDGQPQIVAIDVASGQQWKIGPAQGVPSDPMTHFAVAPWELGRVCAAASMGDSPHLRSWVATITLDPTTGPKFQLVHEARLGDGTAGAKPGDPGVGFAPYGAYPVDRPSSATRPGGTGSAHRSVILEIPGRFFDVDLTSAGAVLTYDPVMRTSWRGPDVPPCIRDGVVYWPTQNTISCAAPGDRKARIINQCDPACSMCFAGKRVYVYAPDTRALSIADDPSHPFRRVRLAWPDKTEIPPNSTWFLFSNHYGLLMAQEGRLFQMLDDEGHPLPWK